MEPNDKEDISEFRGGGEYVDSGTAVPSRADCCWPSYYAKSKFMIEVCCSP